MRILVLDNEPEIVDLLAEVLSCQEWEVCTALRLADARAHFDAGEIAVIIADRFLLPGENGHDFAHRCREAWPDLGIIYMTGSDANRPEHTLREREWLLSKPFTMREVTELVRRAAEV